MSKEHSKTSHPQPIVPLAGGSLPLSLYLALTRSPLQGKTCYYDVLSWRFSPLQPIEFGAQPLATGPLWRSYCATGLFWRSYFCHGLSYCVVLALFDWKSLLSTMRAYLIVARLCCKLCAIRLGRTNHPRRYATRQITHNEGTCTDARSHDVQWAHTNPGGGRGQGGDPFNDAHTARSVPVPPRPSM
jgi:hypothetical protein